MERISAEGIVMVIVLVRGQRVLLDRDLAVLYRVEARALNQAVRRNIVRFPPDFLSCSPAKRFGTHHKL